MAAHGARRLTSMAENLFQILGIELLCGLEGIRFRAPLKTSPALCNVISQVEQEVAPLENDRYLAPDLALAARLIRSGELIEQTVPEIPTGEVPVS
jgi:histidine ammonia-lyase